MDGPEQPGVCHVQEKGEAGMPRAGRGLLRVSVGSSDSVEGPDRVPTSDMEGLSPI